MRMMKSATIVFLLGCSIFTGLARAVLITPSNMVLPTTSGESFSFDFVVSNPLSTSAQAFQSTIGVSGPGTLTFEGSTSEAVDAAAGYWVFGNSAGATTIDLGSNSYQFGDGPDDGVAQLLAADDIMARYTFTWDGTVGDYTFTLDLDTTDSSILNDSFQTEAVTFTSGSYTPGTAAGSFIVSIPEPATLMLLGLGASVFLRKRKA